MNLTEKSIAIALRILTLGAWGREVFLAHDPMARQMPQGMRREGRALVGFLGPYQLVIERG